jgi:hypothetical protein
MPQSVLVVAAKVQMYINGKLFARVTSFQWKDARPHRAIYGLDNGLPYELAPTIIKNTAQMGVLKTQADGGVEAAGMAGNVRDVIREKYFTVMLVDRTTDTVIFQADRCKLVDQSWSVAARGLMTGVVEFECIGWNNEVEPTLKP